MQILSTGAYNQSIGKYKLLGSTAGVGSIITTRIGYYVLISDIGKWKFVEKAQNEVAEIRREFDSLIVYNKAKDKLPRLGLTFIDDERFVQFLSREKELLNLVCLIGIPDISLNDKFNTPNWKHHPIKKLLGDSVKSEDFMVRGTHFPKWFINKRNELKEYKEWRSLWQRTNLGARFFAPPRDGSAVIKDSKGAEVKVFVKDEENGDKMVPLYEPLTQTNLILICPNGHLSDIPWSKFLRAKSERLDMNNLFQVPDCCGSPRLSWTESKTKSEGYGSVYLHCECGMGKGANHKVNLEGLNSMTPNCPGHKPWEIDLSEGGDQIPYEKCDCSGKGGSEKMQVALVTSNNVYFANGFSSLYIPQELAQNKSPEVLFALKYCGDKFSKKLERNSALTKEEFWDRTLDKEAVIDDNNLKVEDERTFFVELKTLFLGTREEDAQSDQFEFYRWQEYKTFTKYSESPKRIEGLKFSDIELPKELSSFFEKIQKLEELKVAQVQLDFTRVKTKERVKVGDKVLSSTEGQNIFSCKPEEVYVLPATEIFGEGLFFQFNESTISDWIEVNREGFERRYKKYLQKPDPGLQGYSAKQKIFNQSFKHFLIHSFSHAIMRELEFSCGYPTASLKERLYISERMSGVLIYTAEGSEGSMGGLVWQGQPEKLLSLIQKCIKRAEDCSSDPLCWESEGQGLYDLNLAACFSCSLVSETACEEMNLGLDRRILVDSEVGFFKDLMF
jgi:hypothetical protein